MGAILAISTGLSSFTLERKGSGAKTIVPASLEANGLCSCHCGESGLTLKDKVQPRMDTDTKRCEEQRIHPTGEIGPEQEIRVYLCASVVKNFLIRPQLRDSG